MSTWKKWTSYRIGGVSYTIQERERANKLASDCGDEYRLLVSGKDEGGRWDTCQGAEVALLQLLERRKFFGRSKP